MRSPPNASARSSSPGWFAFTMHGNYDGKGTRFGGTSVPAQASDPDDVGAYAAVDPASGILRVMLINRDPSKTQAVTLGLTALYILLSVGLSIGGLFAGLALVRHFS